MEKGGSSVSEDANDFVDEKHLVDEVEVNVSSFKFQIDGEDDTEFIDPIQPHVNVTEDDLEVLDFDLLESDQEDVPENARSRGLRKLRKNNMASGIKTTYIEELRPKEMIKRRIRVICNGVVPTLDSKNEYVKKVQGPKQDTSGKEKALMQSFKEDKITCPWCGIVESENQYSWTWFLTCLADDFDLFSNSNFTFITDRQKGLLPIIAKLFPSVEHRFCVRHINENMNLTWKGGDYKEMLWRKWKISSIPCKHVIAAIHDMADNCMDVGTPEDWVHESYKLQTWMNVYSHKINPVNGRDLWGDKAVK
ncbi:mutator type transposase [Tanacetum coccineum]